MEADILRLILFLVGAAVVFGIYMFDRYKKEEPNEHKRDWIRAAQEQPVDDDHVEPSWDSLYEQNSEPTDEPEIDELESEADELEPESDESDELVEEEDADAVDERISSELEQLEEIIHEEHRYEDENGEATPKEQISISFLANEIKKQKNGEQGESLPIKIIQLTIVPHEGEFYGDDILCVVHEVGLELGEMDIFHHYGDDPDKCHAAYSMASMVEPGTFPTDAMDDFSTPGLTIFTCLPGIRDGLTIFADMLHTAEQLANLLDGELRDETHGALSKQTIGHIREEIQEHHRQLQLARSKQ